MAQSHENYSPFASRQLVVLATGQQVRLPTCGIWHSYKSALKDTDTHLQFITGLGSDECGVSVTVETNDYDYAHDRAARPVTQKDIDDYRFVAQAACKFYTEVFINVRNERANPRRRRQGHRFASAGVVA